MTLDTEPVSKNNSTPNAEGKPYEQASHLPPPTTSAAEQEPKLQPSPNHCEITCKKENDWWDKAKRWVEVAGVLLLAIYTFYTIKMYCANKRSADAATNAANIAASQLELTERPWVDADISLGGPLTFNVDGANVPLKIILRNTGHSPALSTVISPLPLISPNSVNAPNYRQQVCKDATRISTTMPLFGIALFPDVRFEQSEGVGIGKEEIEKGGPSKVFPGSHFPSGVFLAPSIVICIAYQPVFNKALVYHTSYIIDLYKLDSANKMGVMFTIGEDVDQSHLALRRAISGAIVAD